MPKQFDFFVSVTSDVQSEYLTPDGTYRFSIDWVGSLRMTISALWSAIHDSIPNLRHAEELQIVIFDEHGKRMRIPIVHYTDDPGRYVNHGRVDYDVTLEVVPVLLDRPLLSL